MAKKKSTKEDKVEVVTPIIVEEKAKEAEVVVTPTTEKVTELKEIDSDVEDVTVAAPAVEELTVSENKVEASVAEVHEVEAPVSIHESELENLLQLEEIRLEAEAENSEKKEDEVVELPKTEVWDEESHEKFARWAKSGAFEIRFKGGLVYDSVTSNAILAFYPAYVRIGHRRFRYDLLQMNRK